MKPRIVAIVGPTATGKSRLAIKLAREFGGEIITADSRQVYKKMDIGTAKPPAPDRALVPHHLIDLIEPDGSFSLAEFQKAAFQAIESVSGHHHVPILAGGTGQYVWSVVENWAVPRVMPDAGLRSSLEQKASTEEGAADIYHELELREPEVTRRIDPRNIRRVIRALEISYAGGPQPAKRAPIFDSLIIGLTAPRPELYRRIESRINGMLDAGLVNEVKNLLEAGYSSDLPSMSGIGYRQIARYIAGKIDLAKAVESIIVDTHRLVRQQYNWFKLSDNRIKWFDITCEPYQKISKLTTAFLGA